MPKVTELAESRVRTQAQGVWLQSVCSQLLCSPALHLHVSSACGSRVREAPVPPFSRFSSARGSHVREAPVPPFSRFSSARGSRVREAPVPPFSRFSSARGSRVREALVVRSEE